MKSSVLTEDEQELFINMTESHRTKPSLTLLVILRNKGISEVKLPIILEQYTETRLKMKNVKLEEIHREINELLSKQSSKCFLKETEDKTPTSDENVAKPLEISLKPSTSSVDFSLIRYTL